MKKEKNKLTKVEVKRKNLGNYPVGDFLIRIKNAANGKIKSVQFPRTKFVVSVAKALAKEGYLEEIEEKEGIIVAKLKFRKKEPLISNIRLISKPGLRIYMKVEEIEKKKGPSILLLSTPTGVVSSRQAINKRVGGEVVAEVL